MQERHVGRVTDFFREIAEREGSDITEYDQREPFDGFMFDQDIGPWCFSYHARAGRDSPVEGAPSKDSRVRRAAPITGLELCVLWT